MIYDHKFPKCCLHKFHQMVSSVVLLISVALMLQDRVIGILDWELSTLGNQMCDVAYSCLVMIINL